MSLTKHILENEILGILPNIPESDSIVGAINGIVKADGNGNISAAIVGTDYLKDLIQDTTPQLGGELDALTHSIGFTLQTYAGIVGTTVINWKAGNKVKFTFGTGNETLTFTAPNKSCNLALIIVQDATGGRTITWPSTCKWADGSAPTLSTAANAIDVVSFLWTGNEYLGVASLNFS